MSSEQADNDYQQKIAAARDIVTRFLREEFNPAEHPEIFEEDILYFAVARLDVQDIGWLLDQVAHPEWPRELRASIVPMMLNHYAEGQAMLEEED
ncbi:hypothetical protein AB0H00_10070 [Nocardia sp. NPDC023852]|uniref:hypothetical protein n=1 Tax=Nocardia sp. NPDC023852 TaxID=3154697 RepID=UPI0033D6FEAC